MLREYVAFFLSVRDSELACDEGVLRSADDETKKQYGYMLLELCESFGRGRLRAVPLFTTEMIGGNALFNPPGTFSE